MYGHTSREASWDHTMEEPRMSSCSRSRVCIERALQNNDSVFWCRSSLFNDPSAPATLIKMAAKKKKQSSVRLKAFLLILVMEEDESQRRDNGHPKWCYGVQVCRKWCECWTLDVLLREANTVAPQADLSLCWALSFLSCGVFFSRLS